MLVHASCVLWQNKGILLLGESGSGKSTAALRLIEKGAVLIADDYIDIDENLIGHCPDNIQGQIEVRGVGIVDIKSLPKTQVHIAIECHPDFEKIERIPLDLKWSVGEKSIPLFYLNSFDCLFCTKVGLLLKRI